MGFITENREILPIQAICTWFFMNKKILTCKCGLKRIYPKSTNFPKVLGRFMWWAVSENRRIHKKSDLKQWLRKLFFQWYFRSYSKSSGVHNLMTVEGSSGSLWMSLFVRKFIRVCKAQQFCHAYFDIFLREFSEQRLFRHK